MHHGKAEWAAWETGHGKVEIGGPCWFRERGGCWFEFRLNVVNTSSSIHKVCAGFFCAVIVSIAASALSTLLVCPMLQHLTILRPSHPRCALAKCPCNQWLLTAEVQERDARAAPQELPCGLACLWCARRTSGIAMQPSMLREAVTSQMSLVMTCKDHILYGFTTDPLMSPT